jgi:hypothetical protein
MALIPGFGGIIGILTLPLSKQLNLAACAWMLPITGLAIILTWATVAANVAGHTKRTFVNGAEFVFYSTGNIIGPFLFIPSESPRYPSAIKGLLGVYAACMMFTALLGLLLWRKNVYRSKESLDTAIIDEAG